MVRSLVSPCGLSKTFDMGHLVTDEVLSSSNDNHVGSKGSDCGGVLINLCSLSASSV